MEVKTIEELLAQPVGAVVKRNDIRFIVPDAKTQRAYSKWQAKTDGYKFEGGDVYILDDNASELLSFKYYLKKKFRLTCRTLKAQGKVICTLERITPAKPRKKSNNKKPNAVNNAFSGGQNAE